MTEEPFFHYCILKSDEALKAFLIETLRLEETTRILKSDLSYVECYSNGNREQVDNVIKIESND